ncbi:uncharacterized protein DS421_8g246980 [Arachis hypogaea]|nr:uncharacterized protein DS421_8g246980 [Arachis hypogaea]
MTVRSNIIVINFQQETSLNINLEQGRSWLPGFQSSTTAMSLRLHTGENLRNIVKSSSRNLVSQLIGNDGYQRLAVIREDAGSEGA